MCAVVWILYGANALASPSAPDPEIPFALAISGGVSLGSYEAGLNWALMRFLTLRRDHPMRPVRPALKAASGASAGSINALVSAIGWCVDPNKAAASGLYADTIDNNLFRDIWLRVGIDDLLPAEGHTARAYRPDDGLLTRKALQPAIQRIKRLLAAPIFRDDCRVPVGLTLTRVVPAELTVDGIRVENQRFMIPFELRAHPTRPGAVAFASGTLSPTHPGVGNIIYPRGQLVEGAGNLHLIPTDQVIEAILASSAFPIAFGRRRLEYCAHIETDEPAVYSPECPEGYAPASAEFIDGGLFDNVPLGTARTLAEPREEDVLTHAAWEQAARRYNYVYLEPGNRRLPAGGDDRRRYAVSDGLEATPMTFGLRSQLRFVEGAVLTGRNYELYSVLRSGEWTGRSYEYSRRLIAALEQRHPELAESPPAPSGDGPASADCQAAFADGLAETTALRLARACILSAADRLERMYQGDEPGVTAGQITALREELIRWMTELARAIGAPQLRLSIEKLGRDKLGDRRILVSSRYGPITGALLGKFAAFIDRPFREFDYYTGIYDGANGIAAYLCERSVDYRACFAQHMHSLYERFAVASIPDADRVFLSLLAREHHFDDTASTDWNWATTALQHRQTQSANNMTVILNGLWAAEEIEDKVEQFRVFIHYLLDNGYNTSHSSRFMKNIAALADQDEAGWYYPMARRISDRLLVLEERENAARPGDQILLGAMAMGALAVHSFAENEDALTGNRGTAPSGTWQRALPYELGSDLRNGGLYMAWEPRIRVKSTKLALNLRLSPFLLNRFGDDTIRYAQADLFVSYRRNGVFSSIGAGPTYAHTWDSWQGHARDTLGASVYVGFLQDKLRLSGGTRSFKNDGFAGDDIYLTLSITDIPGFVYWLSRGF